MNNEDILKRIYARAVEKRQESFTVPQSPALQKPASASPKISLEVFGGEGERQDSAVRVTETGKARVRAVAEAMHKLAAEREASGAPATGKQAVLAQQISDVADSAVDSVTVSGVDQPVARPTTERDTLIQELMHVYRDKRQMIDDLPPRHRQLLEKMGKVILGTDKIASKAPPKEL